MDFVTCDQMKLLEQKANASGLSYLQMMENAGTAAANIILKKAPPLDNRTRVLFFCGKGNNGGDGFVVARRLAEQNYQVFVSLVDGKPVTEDAKTNYDRLTKDIQVVDMTCRSSSFLDTNDHYNIVVDAIYGTGFHGSLRSNASKAAAFINQSLGQATVFALDIPSGLGGDMSSSDLVNPNTVRAHYTIIFHKPKPVHMQEFSSVYCGKKIVVDIGIPKNLL